jgi:integrase
MASITKIPNKDGSTSYRVNWRVGEGKDRRPETKTFRSKEEARAHRRDVEENIESKRVGSFERLTVFGYLDGWLDKRRKDERNPISPTSIDGYARNIAIAKRGLEKDRDLSKLTTTQLEDAYDRLLVNGKLLPEGRTGPLSKQTVRHVHTVLHKAFKDAKRAKLIASNPAADAEPPKTQRKKKGGYTRKVREFTKDEVITLLDLVMTDKRYPADAYPMVATLAVCGLRRGELAGLAFDSIELPETGNGKLVVTRNIVEIDPKLVKDGNDERIRVLDLPKTEASERGITIPPVLVAILRAQRARVLELALKAGKDYHRSPMFLFPGPLGLPMDPKLITRRMERLIARAKIDATNVSPVHSWRHTAGTLLWHAHKNIKQVQGRLGHATPDITMALYVHNTPEAEDEAAEFFGQLINR